MKAEIYSCLNTNEYQRMKTKTRWVDLVLKQLNIHHYLWIHMDCDDMLSE